jgi:hypothetical protein
MPTSTRTSTPTQTSTPTNTATPTALPGHLVSQVPLIFQVTDQTFSAVFLSTARPSDTSLVSSGNFWLLPVLTAGQHGAAYTSWADAQTNFPASASQFGAFTYNPEHWSNTPQTEQDNLVATVLQASATIHAMGLPYVLVPDQSFDAALLPQLAPYVDIYGL